MLIDLFCVNMNESTCDKLNQETAYQNILLIFCCRPQLAGCLSPTRPPKQCSLMPCWGIVMGTVESDTWSWICHWIKSSSSFPWACRSFWCPWLLPERFLLVSSSFSLPSVPCANHRTSERHWHCSNFPDPWVNWLTISLRAGLMELWM